MKKISTTSGKIDKLIKLYNDARAALPAAVLRIITAPIIHRELIDKDNVDGLFDVLTANHNLNVFELTTNGILTPATRQCLVLLHRWRSARDDPRATLEQMQLMMARWVAERDHLANLQVLCERKYREAVAVGDVVLQAQWSGHASVAHCKIARQVAAMQGLQRRLVQVTTIINANSRPAVLGYNYAVAVAPAAAGVN